MLKFSSIVYFFRNWKQLKGRGICYAVVYALLMLCACLLIRTTFYASGSQLSVLKTEDEKARLEDNRRLAKRTYGEINNIQGDITDRNGTVLVTSSAPDTPAVYKDPEAYTSTIGFAEGENYYLLAGDNSNRTWLYDANADTDKGCTIRTTLDSDLQEYCYQKLKSECVGEGGTQGNIVVLDAKTGAVITAAYYPSYSVSQILDDVRKAKDESDDKSYKNLPWSDIAQELGYRIYPMLNPKVPGSVFKIVTSIALAELGEEALETPVNDTTGSITIDEMELRNADGVYGEIGFQEAFSHSVNVYFATKAINEIGKTRLDTVAQRCGLDESQVFDFGRMASSYAFKDDLKELARTSIGQQNVQMSAMHIAMLTQGISAGGSVARPHMIMEISRSVKEKTGSDVRSYIKGETVEYEKIDPQYKNICTSEVAGIIGDAMTATGSRLRDKWGAPLIISGEEIPIACKTGTGEIDLPSGGQSGYNNIWLTSYAPADDPRYVVVINRYYADGYGSDLYPDLVGLYEKLLKNDAAGQTEEETEE